MWLDCEDHMHDNSANSLIEFLRTSPLHKLNARGIYAKISCDLHRVSLTYDQTEADPLDEIASLCRGIVIASLEQIDENVPIKFPKIVARPFKRFFNAGQNGAAIKDPSKAIIQVKYDGTLIIVYHFDDVWHVATRSVPDADVERHDGKTYAQMFWRLWQDRSTSLLDPANTYVFELIGPQNRHVVNYQTDELILLGVVNTATGQEHDPRETAALLDVKHTYTDKTLISLDSLAESIKDLDPTDGEGFVVVEINEDEFNRVKVKCPRFSFANGAQQLLDRSPRTALRTVMSDSFDDILASTFLTAQVRAAVVDLQTRIKIWCTNAEEELMQIKKIKSDRKATAREIFQMKNKLLAGGAFSIIYRDMTVMSWLVERITAPCVNKRFMNAVLEAVGGYHI